MSIFDVYSNRRAVLEFDTTRHSEISREDIELLLWQTWKCTPSKNNFMPYNVYAVGPDRQDYKNLVYQNCLNNEGKFTEVETKYGGPNPTSPYPPFYSNIKNCTWLLAFTLRLEDKLNPYQKNATARGQNFEYATRAGLYKSVPAVSIEIGMFCDLMGGLCLEKGWGVSQVLCFSRKLSTWADVPFITEEPLLLMPIGIVKTHRAVARTNRRPNFPRIVKFVE